MGDFLRVTGDGWIAIATFAGAMAILVSGAGVLFGIFYGAKQFVREQEARDTRRYLLDEGALALKSGIDDLLELTRQNYVIVSHLIEAVELMGQNDPLRPRSEDIPRLLPEQRISFNFQAIGPASRLLNCMEIGELATKAFAALYAINVGFEFNVRQPVMRFYEGEDWSQVEVHDWCGQARALAEKKYLEAEEYRNFSFWLGEGVLRAQELGLARFDDLAGTVHRDATIRGLGENVRKMLSEANTVT